MSHDQMQDVTGRLAVSFLNQMLAVCALSLTVGLPFFFANKVGAGLVLLFLSATTLVARRLAMQGRPTRAMHGFVLGFGLIVLPLMALSANLTISTLLLFSVLPMYGAICGVGSAAALGTTYIASAAAVQWAINRGVPIPQLFPAPPGAQLVAVFITMTGVLLPLAVLFRELNQSVKKAETENLRREQAEARLRDSLKRFADFAQSASDSFWELGADLRIVSVSATPPGAARAPDQCVGLYPWQVWQSADPAYAKHAQTLRDTVAARLPFRSLELPVDHGDGSLRWSELSGVPVFDAESRVCGFRGVASDITERKRIEQMKSEFVSTVSHELRTPLTSISGALGLIAGGAMGEVPEAMRPMVGIAHKNSVRLSYLIDDLLDMETLVAGKIRFDFQVQPLMPLLEQSLESVRAYGESLDVHFDLAQRCDDVHVRVDGGRLQQVLANFLSNAAKFSPAGECVTVRAASLGKVVRVEVIDRGHGIAERFRPHIFQKFSQADSSDTRQKGGTGLGLAISKELIEQMNGLIGFTSVPGQGACFHFTLPAWHAAATEAPAPSAGAVAADAPRLLIVEDEPDIAALLATLLGSAGYRTDVAHDALTAQRLLAQARYAAMTLDLLLPDMSGVALMRQLRADGHTARLPIVVVSAYTDDGKLAIRDEFNAIEWVDKPVDRGQLLEVVQRAILRAAADA